MNAKRHERSIHQSFLCLQITIFYLLSNFPVAGKGMGPPHETDHKDIASFPLGSVNRHDPKTCRLMLQPLEMATLRPIQVTSSLLLANPIFDQGKPQ
jgi:hypothetical protein